MRQAKLPRRFRGGSFVDIAKLLLPYVAEFAKKPVEELGKFAGRKIGKLLGNGMNTKKKALKL